MSNSQESSVAQSHGEPREEVPNTSQALPEVNSEATLQPPTHAPPDLLVSLSYPSESSPKKEPESEKPGWQPLHGSRILNPTSLEGQGQFRSSWGNTESSLGLGDPQSRRKSEGDPQSPLVKLSNLSEQNEHILNFMEYCVPRGEPIPVALVNRIIESMSAETSKLQNHIAKRTAEIDERNARIASQTKQIEGLMEKLKAQQKELDIYLDEKRKRDGIFGLHPIPNLQSFPMRSAATRNGSVVGQGIRGLGMRGTTLNEETLSDAKSVIELSDTLLSGLFSPALPAQELERSPRIDECVNIGSPRLPPSLFTGKHPSPTRSEGQRQPSPRHPPNQGDKLSSDAGSGPSTRAGEAGNSPAPAPALHRPGELLKVAKEINQSIMVMRAEVAISKAKTLAGGAPERRAKRAIGRSVTWKQAPASLRPSTV